MTKQNIPTRNITLIYNNVLNILHKAKNNSYHAINTNMVKAYWEIGKIIVEEEQKGVGRAKYGVYLIKNLSKKLNKALGKGFGESNLGYMRQLYLTFPIHQTLCGELSWSHYTQLISIEDKLTRNFYEKQCLKEK